MIAKVGKSTSISGTIKYLLGDKERVAWTEAYNLADNSESFAISQMQTTAEVSKTLKPMYHLSVSWDSGDQPTREQMFDSAKQILSDLSLSDHEALIVAHNDQDYEHIHIAVNRVHPETGKAWETWKDYHRLEKSLRAIEKQNGWREVPGHHHRLEGQEKPSYGHTLNRSDCERLKKGELPFSKLILKLAGKDFEQSKSWLELHQRLNQKGLTILRGTRGTGGKITDGSEYANLSSVHRSFSMNRLTKRFGPFQNFPESLEKQHKAHAIVFFSAYEIADRVNSPKKSKYLNALKKSLHAYRSVKDLQNIVKACTSLTFPQSAALKILKKAAGTVVNNIKQNQKQIEKGGLEY
jgi:hypothetical protein